MPSSPYPEIQAQLDQLDAADRDARALVEGLDESSGTWRPAPGAWSIAECLDHLAVANRVYIASMKGAADRARREGRLRRGPAKPGILGSAFVRYLEPPVKRKTKNPRRITPRPSPPLADALERFLTSQSEVREFISAIANLDLASVKFANPFIRGLRWSLATGIHVFAAHDRRHLWQASNVRKALAET